MVLVLWKNGSKNFAYANELKSVNCEVIQVGCGMKILYKKLWYYGKVYEYLERALYFINEQSIKKHFANDNFCCRGGIRFISALP